MRGLDIKLVLVLSFLVLAVSYGLFYIHLAPLSNFLVVGFDGFRGINFLGGLREVTGILYTGLAIALVNLALTAVLFRRQRFLAQTISYFTLAVSVLILITISFIIVSN